MHGTQHGFPDWDILYLSHEPKKLKGIFLTRIMSTN